MIATNTLQEFRSKFRISELRIVSTDSWTWSVRPDQPTLGSGVISLNRFAPTLSDVEPDEMAELAGLIALLEKAIKDAFNHRIMNYLMLMMVDHHVHYHVIPRYDSARNFGNLVWVDNGWPLFPSIVDSQHQDDGNALKAVHRALGESARSLR